MTTPASLAVVGLMIAVLLSVFLLSVANYYLPDTNAFHSTYEEWFAYSLSSRTSDAAEVAWRPIDSRDWKPHIAYDHPYNNTTPKLDVVWNRGYYSASLPHRERPITYYNAKGLSARALSPAEFSTFFTPNQCGIIWIRLTDVKEWVHRVLPHSTCINGNITIITSDEPWDVPDALPRGVSEKIFQSEKIKAWYSTNVVRNQSKLFPVPLGLPIHYGFPGSPDAWYTVESMNNFRLAAKPFTERKTSILYDIGTLGGSQRRDQGRKAAKEALGKCPRERIEIKPKGGPLETWPLYASHKFAIVSVGVGFDTFRFWEYLFFGTVPIVLSSPLDSMYLDAHVPCVIVNDWSEVCSWTDHDIEKLSERFQKWIANSHMWVRPSLWVPRDQAQMDRLCDVSPGCRSGGHFLNATRSNEAMSPII